MIDLDALEAKIYVGFPVRENQALIDELRAARKVVEAARFYLAEYDPETLAAFDAYQEQKT